MHLLVFYKDIYQKSWPNHQDIRLCVQMLVKIKYQASGDVIMLTLVTGVCKK
jgi:hypothetical protein